MTKSIDKGLKSLIFITAGHRPAVAVQLEIQPERLYCKDPVWYICPAFQAGSVVADYTANYTSLVCGYEYIAFQANSYKKSSS